MKNRRPVNNRIRLQFEELEGRLVLSGAPALGPGLGHLGLALTGVDPPTTAAGVTYYDSANVGIQPVSAWTGITSAGTSGQYLITGTSNSHGLLFEGTIAGVGASYAVNYPGAVKTSVYGPCNLGGGTVQLVGSYTAAGTHITNGFLFSGTVAYLSQAANYRTIAYPGATSTVVHSTMGGFAVGVYQPPTGPVKAFLYDIAHGQFLPDIVFPKSTSDTAYGIWYNGGTSYTLCGGYAVNSLTRGYLVDYNSATGNFSSWQSFACPAGANFYTHFEGISGVGTGAYTLNAVSVDSAGNYQGSRVSVPINPDGTFGQAIWVNLNYPGYDPTAYVTSSNSVCGNQVVGVVDTIGKGVAVLSYQATVQYTTSTALVSSANPAVVGQPVTLTATVSADLLGSGTPTGTVTFWDGATALGTGTLNGGGQASYTTSALAAGTHLITASYGGDANFAGNTSATLSQTVNPAGAATATATVAAGVSGGGARARQVAFRDRKTTLGTGTLNGDMEPLAIFTQATGRHSIAVAYAGDASYITDTSVVLKQTGKTAGSAGLALTGIGQPTSFAMGPPSPSEPAVLGVITLDVWRFTGGDAMALADGPPLATEPLARAEATGGLGSLMDVARLDRFFTLGRF
jgi:hypothetical protein